MTVLFSVEPSHKPSGTLIPSVVTPKRDDAAAALQLDPVEHQRREADVRQRPRHQRLEVLAGAADELAADRRLRGRALGVDDVLADRLTRAREAARRHAGEHLLQHHPRQRVTVSEVRIGGQRHLALAVDGPGARALDRDTPAAERDLAVLVAVAHRGRDRGCAWRASGRRPRRPPPRAARPARRARRDAQRQQPLLRCADQLAQRLLHARRQRLRIARRPAPALRSSWRSLRLGGLDFALATLPTGTDEAEGPPPTKFYELRDNLTKTSCSPSTWHLSAPL